jgi:hypothetical protein
MMFYPEYAIAYFPPTQESTVSASLTASRSANAAPFDVRNPINFVRNT